MAPTDAVLMAAKNVLREYTRTHSTRALKTHGLTDDGDPTLLVQQQARSGSGSSGDTPQERSRSKSRTRGNAAHESGGQTGSTSQGKQSLMCETGHTVKHRASKSQSQPPDARSRKTSISASWPTASASTSRPSSLALTKSTHTYPNETTSSSSVDHIPPVPRLDPASPSPTSSPTSPRLSTSHAEAFAMRDLDMRDLDGHYNHRDDSCSLPHPPGAPVPPRHTALPLPATPSPPHGQRSAFGFGERIKRAFGSSKQHQHPKEQKEPVSPTTDDGEDEPKTANHDGKFAPPWLTVVRRSEKEHHERMIRTLNNSFESVGLIPPQDKKKANKSRSQKSSKGEECPMFEDVPEDSMCMLLPLWPGETEPTSQPPSQPLSRHSSRNARHTATQSLGCTTTTTTTAVPLQERKFLLVYYVPFNLDSPTSDGSNGGSNNKKRRRPQTAGERPPQHHHHIKTPGGAGSFRVVARLLGYDDVRSSGVRLPEKGLAVTGPLAEAAMAVPSNPPPGAHPQHYSAVIAQCDGSEKTDGVELVQEGLETLGLMDPTAPRTFDVNGDPTSVRLSAVGRAIVEMVWCGCVSLMTFS